MILVIWNTMKGLNQKIYNTHIKGVNHSKKKFWKLGFCAHLIQFFLLIPNMVPKNRRMHLNPLYDRKTGLSQPTQFEKKIKTRGRAFFRFLTGLHPTHISQVLSSF